MSVDVCFVKTITYLLYDIGLDSMLEYLRPFKILYFANFEIVRYGDGDVTCPI